MHQDREIIAGIFDLSETCVLRIAGGGTLYEVDGKAEAIYLVLAGAFAVFRDGPGGRTLIGLVRSGEIIGEAAVISGTARSATVVALRDSEVAVLPSGAFFELAYRSPLVMGAVARLLVARALNAGASHSFMPPKVIALAAVSARIDVRNLAERLAGALRALGQSVLLLANESSDRSPAWWAKVEDDYDFVLCAICADELAWRDVCRRQADRMRLIGNSADQPPMLAKNDGADPLREDALVDLVLLHDGSRPRNAALWLNAVAPERLHHLLPGHDCARLARSLAGRSIAVVLSGGGARAFAHLGAVKALRRAGVPIDAVCGTSMGAIIAAGVAAGWDDEEADERMRTAFVTSNPLDDIALPLVAMTRGRKVDRRLAEQFGDWNIEDLSLPFFCVSADLNTGSHIAHRAGPLTLALRASISLPGVLPPVTIGNRVLVDGGTLLNLPSGLMCAAHDGPVIAVDLSRSLGLLPKDVAKPQPLLRWLWSGAWRRGPPIVSILMRSATIAADPDLRAAKEAADLYVIPEVADIEIRNWRAYDRAVAAGERAMQRALDELETPVESLRIERERRATINAASPGSSNLSL